MQGLLSSNRLDKMFYEINNRIQKNEGAAKGS